jgi:hypothetical protein
MKLELSRLSSSVGLLRFKRRMCQCLQEDTKVFFPDPYSVTIYDLIPVSVFVILAVENIIVK